MPHFTYILECSDKTLYVGYTKDIKRRVIEHNTSAKGARYTKARRPVKLVRVEKFRTLSKALKRECEIKSWSRAKKLQLLLLP